MDVEIKRSLNSQSALLSTREVEKREGQMVRIKIQNRHGLHARPAAAIARSLVCFASEVSITFRKKTANARSVLGLLMLGVPCGSSITIRAFGPDASTALKSVEELVKKRFDEGEV